MRYVNENELGAKQYRFKINLLSEKINMEKRMWSKKHVKHAQVNICHSKQGLVIHLLPTSHLFKDIEDLNVKVSCDYVTLDSASRVLVVVSLVVDL